MTIKDPKSGHDPIRQALSLGQPPTWASGWGQDGHGIFVDFIYKGVTQRLRWIPAGSFQMGSPKDEPGRYGDEGPQHEVTFKQGFWLFDTACPQALWQGVMGENPSQFQFPDHPVEQVSWNKLQTFLQRINAEIPGLQLALPSEAQWEYACRAGTTTRYSFGDRITSEQVNFRADGKEGNHRGKTVPVASLPPNPWGLYEMHGNVDEWCADEKHASYQGAPSDGRAWTSPGGATPDGVGRVVRGGSWRDNARFARSASRVWFPPDVRDDSLGFRCSRVHL